MVSKTSTSCNTNNSIRTAFAGLKFFCRPNEGGGAARRTWSFARGERAGWNAATCDRDDASALHGGISARDSSMAVSPDHVSNAGRLARWTPDGVVHAPRFDAAGGPRRPLVDVGDAS
jgi:hypothetical protein